MFNVVSRLVARTGILIFVVCAYASAASAGFSAGNRVNVPDGRCDLNGAEKANFYCDVTRGGTVVEVVTGPDGSFPHVKNGRSYFKYRVTDDGRGASPSHLDFELPICDVANGQPNLKRLLNRDLSGPGGVEVLDRDESTGLTFPNARVLKLDSPVPSGGYKTYTVVYNSDVISAAPIDFAIKTGERLEFGGMGILGAGCRRIAQKFWKQCKTQAPVQTDNGTFYKSTFRSQVRNAGDVDLLYPRLQEFNTTLKCKIMSVNGLAVTPALAIPNKGKGYVRIPTNARFDGVLRAGNSSGEKGEAVNLGIQCTHKEPNLVNVLKSKVSTAGGYVIIDKAAANMGVQCPIQGGHGLAIHKSCDGKYPGERLMAKNGHLVVQICPRIKVQNKGSKPLHNVTVYDKLVGPLKAGLNIGSLPAGKTIDLGRDLKVDTCYMPSAPNQPAVGDNGTPNYPGDDKYKPETATFTNTARVKAVTGTGQRLSDSDSATCSLADWGVPDRN
jgi:hypothetical protein